MLNPLQAALVEDLGGVAGSAALLDVHTQRLHEDGLVYPVSGGSGKRVYER